MYRRSYRKRTLYGKMYNRNHYTLIGVKLA